MRLAILHPFQFRFARGIERFAWSLPESLARFEVETDLLTWCWPTPISWGQVLPGMRIRQVPYVRYFMDRVAIPYDLTWLVRGRYDWVMLFFAGYGEAETISLLRRFRSQSYCIVFHFPREQVPHRYNEFGRFDLARRADRLVAVSQHVAQGVEAQFGRSCTVIGNGVNPQIFRPHGEARATVRKELGIDNDAPVLITLAALEERKGVQWVIRAIPNLLREFPRLQYWVLGDGAYQGNLETEISQLGLKPHVHLLGQSCDVPSFLAAADIGCLLSYGDAFPIALIECMAVALPVVVSCHPPFEELVRPEWGVMVNEKQTAVVASAIRTLLQNPNRRHTMGHAGRQRVQSRHTWTHVAHDYLRLLALPP